ncbi:MAG: hypothetical protein KBS62_03115 [Oscillospiraceae bacterium]|nr:hypothetical protein [Candidatus Ruminococcus equi]
MALEILTVGATVKTCLETTAGTRPTTGYTVLPDVNQAPEIELSTEAIDVSNITDAITRYKAGRQDPGGDKTFTLNHTEAVITAWEGLVSAVAGGSGKRLWFEYCFPGATNSFFWAGDPKSLGSAGIEQNALDTITAHAICQDVAGWATAST